jgi:hypothetical protein
VLSRLRLLLRPADRGAIPGASIPLWLRSDALPRAPGFAAADYAADAADYAADYAVYAYTAAAYAADAAAAAIAQGGIDLVLLAKKAMEWNDAN